MEQLRMAVGKSCARPTCQLICLFIYAVMVLCYFLKDALNANVFKRNEQSEFIFQGQPCMDSNCIHNKMVYKRPQHST